MSETPMRQLTFHPDDEPVMTWQVGDVRVTRVVEGISEFPRGFLPDLSDERVEACMPWAAPYVLADRSRFLFSVHSFVVQTPEQVVVVDTCVGPHAERFMHSDPSFAERLAAAIPGGLAGVDVVICTHLHFDHVGWNTRRDGDRLVPTFPNARYLVTDAELRAARTDDPLDVWQPSVQPLLDAGAVDVVEPDHRIDAHLRLEPSPGHTAGHVCVVIDSSGERALITGDSTHSPLQFAYPDATAVRADADAPQAIATRTRQISDLVESGMLVLGTHFPTPTSGRVRADGTSVWFDADVPS